MPCSEFLSLDPSDYIGVNVLEIYTLWCTKFIRIPLLVEIPALLKKPPILIGGVVLIVVIIVIAKRGSSTSSGSGNYQTQVDAVNANNLGIAQINADVEKQSITSQVDSLGLSIAGQVNLAGISAQKDVALAQVVSTTNLTSQQLENNRILGLSQEDTKRLINTQDNQTQLTLGVTALDTQRAIANRAYASQDYANVLNFQLGTAKISSDERVQDFTTSRALTYATISGSNQVAAIKANKPSTLQTIFGGLGNVAKLASVFLP